MRKSTRRLQRNTDDIKLYWKFQVTEFRNKNWGRANQKQNGKTQVKKEDFKTND